MFDKSNSAPHEPNLRCRLARALQENKAIADQPPLLKPFYDESDFNERLRVSNWIVRDSMIMQSRKPSNSDFWWSFNMSPPNPRLHCRGQEFDRGPTRPSPTFANQVFKDNSIEVRGQFNCTMNMPSTRRATFAWA